jgi:mono/diheme cytochrome c family protein
VAGVAASRPLVLNSAGVVVAVPGVALQGRGWPHRSDSDGDDAPTGLTSRFNPAESREKGSRVQLAPLQGRGVFAVREWAAQCHGADSGHAAQFPAVAGMGFP